MKMIKLFRIFILYGGGLLSYYAMSQNVASVTTYNTVQGTAPVFSTQGVDYIKANTTISFENATYDESTNTILLPAGASLDDVLAFDGEELARRLQNSFNFNDDHFSDLDQDSGFVAKLGYATITNKKYTSNKSTSQPLSACYGPNNSGRNGKNASTETLTLDLKLLFNVSTAFGDPNSSPQTIDISKQYTVKGDDDGICYIAPNGVRFFVEGAGDGWKKGNKPKVSDDYIVEIKDGPKKTDRPRGIAYGYRPNSKKKFPTIAFAGAGFIVAMANQNYRNYTFKVEKGSQYLFNNTPYPHYFYFGDVDSYHNGSYQAPPNGTEFVIKVTNNISQRVFRYSFKLNNERSWFFTYAKEGNPKAVLASFFSDLSKAENWCAQKGSEVPKFGELTNVPRSSISGNVGLNTNYINSVYREIGGGLFAEWGPTTAGSGNNSIIHQNYHFSGITYDGVYSAFYNGLIMGSTGSGTGIYNKGGGSNFQYAYYHALADSNITDTKYRVGSSRGEIGVLIAGVVCVRP